MNSRTHPKSKTTNTAGQPASLSTVLPTTQQHPPVSSTSSVAAASQVAQSAMQQPQSHLQHSTTGPPSVNATTASGQNHSKPYYKKGGASGGGYNGKKSYCVNNFGNAGQSNYGGGGHMHSGAVAGNYHGQAHHMKPHTRDRHAQVAGSGNAYDSYTTTNSTTNSNYIKPCNNPNGGNSSSGPSYETFTKSKELGSTGSLSGSNCSATTNLSKSNSGSTTTGGGQKSNHQSGNWNHMNQWKSSRRNNNHINNYMSYDSSRHSSNNYPKYDSVGNSSSASSGNSSTPATNDSPTSKSSTPEEYDQNDQPHSSSPSLNTQPASVDSSQASSESNIVIVDSIVVNQANEAVPIKSVSAQDSNPSAVSIPAAEVISQELEKLSVSNAPETVSEPSPSGVAAASTPISDDHVLLTGSTTSAQNAPTSNKSDSQPNKIWPNAGQFNTVPRAPKHSYNNSSSYQGYHQSNYYKSGPSHSYHTYGRGNGGGKKGIHGQTNYNNANMHPAAIAAIKNQNTVPAYLTNVASGGRPMHNKQPQAYPNMQLAGQHGAAMHPMAAIATPPMAGQTAHLASSHPGAAAYIDGNVTPAGLFPYGVPAHMFYSLPHANQAHLHQQQAQSMMHPHAMAAHAMSQHQQMVAANAAHVAAAMVPQQQVPASQQQSSASNHNSNSGQANSGVSIPSAAAAATGQLSTHSATNSVAQQMHPHSNSTPSQHSNACDSMQAQSCGDCCAPPGTAPGYYGAPPLLNYPHGVQINYPFTPASLVPFQPYPTPFGGAKLQPHFFSHPIGTPINYMDMNPYMQFMQPNTYAAGMLAAANSAESHMHPQAAGQQAVLVPAVVQSPPLNSGGNVSSSASVGNEYGELSRPGSSYEAQMMESNYAVAMNAAASYDPHKQPYTLLGYMPQTGSAPMHQMPPNGAEYPQMLVWQQEAGPSGAAPHSSNSSTVATAGSVATPVGSEQTSLTSQNYSTDSMVMVNYAVGSACDTNNPTTSEITDK